MSEKKIDISDEQKHDNAYVWLLMKGDSYLPGIYTSIYSVLRTNPKADLVVMVTKDVSSTARNLLSKIVKLVDIDYIRFNTRQLKTKKQQELYSKWLSVAYTKWNVLKLIQYKKILFLDGDTIVLHNIDHLFNLQAPAAPFNNPFVKPIGNINSHLEGKKGNDKYLLHDTLISKREVYNCLTKNGMIFTASTILLEPSDADFNKYIDMVKSMEPFGFSNCHSMVDEQSLAYYYSFKKNVNWINIHSRYNYINWKKGFLEINDIPYIMHYFSEKKPWNMKYDEWPDVICWWKMAIESVQKTNINCTDLYLDAEQYELAINANDDFTKSLYNKQLPNTDAIKSCMDLITYSYKYQ